MKSVAGSSGGPLLGPGLKERALFFRQLSGLLVAGLPAARAITVLAEQSSGTMRRTLLEVVAGLDKGKPLHAALAPYPYVFDDYSRAVIRAGELSGTLHHLLPRLADGLEEDLAMRQQLQIMLVYPTLVLHVALLAPPLAEWFTHGFEAYAQLVLPRLALVYGLGTLLWLGQSLARRVPALGSFQQTVAAWTPGLAGVVRTRALAFALRSLGNLLEGGFNAREALEVAGRSCGNVWVGSRLLLGLNILDRHGPMSQALGASGLLPKEIRALLLTGDESGQLPAMLLKAAEYLQQAYKMAMQKWMAVLPVLVTLGVGGLVAWQYIQTFVGIMSPLKELMP